MKRENKIKFKKIGGGSFKFQGHLIKPNQIFKAYARDIPRAFRDCIIPMEGGTYEETNIVEEIKTDGKPIFKIEPKGRGWFNIVNADGKVINEKALRDDEAKEMLKELNT